MGKIYKKWGLVNGFAQYFIGGAENITHQFNTITPSLTQRGDGLAPQHNLHVPSATAHNV